jgi:signal transduction histidine kinase
MWSYAKSGTFANLPRMKGSIPKISPHPSLTCALNALSRWDAVLVGIAGAAVLLGWLINSETLKRIAPGFVAMNPLTAVCFIAAASSLSCFWCSDRFRAARNFRAGQILAGVLVLAGTLKLLDYTFGWETGVDRLLFHHRLQADAALPNRMAPNTAFNFLLSGLALFSLNRANTRRTALAQNLSWIVLFHSLLALLGYAYSANYLYGVGSYIPMALHTATLFFLLSVGILFTQTEGGAVAIFVSDSLGGVIARRLLPFALGVPALLGALRLLGERRGLYSSELGVTVMVLVCIATFTALIWWNALLLNRADGERREAEAELRQAHDELESRVAERTAELTRLNESLRGEIAERERAEREARMQQDERKKLEEQFLRSQRMESLGSLAGGIAHDLNNALVPVLMGAQLLREPNADQGQRETILDLIAGSARRCSEMVKQIVTFARGTREKSKRVELSALIGEMEKIVRDTFPKSIRINLRVAANLWNIEGAATELHQVLMNLCVNARDAMPQGGELEIAAENIDLTRETAGTLRGAGEGAHVAISVRDTGTGIPAELLDSIFEPFFTTKSPGKGTGLGLSTVASIIKRHNGGIEVRSRVGKGTTFKLYFPAVKVASATQAQESSSPLPSGRGEKILVVDDEQMVLELVKNTLENYGYQVLTARDGLEAVACFDAHKDEIRLVITDTDMPYLNGISAIRQMQAVEPALPVILASGGGTDTEFSKGDTRVLTLRKPYDVKQLLESVAAGLKRGK